MESCPVSTGIEPADYILEQRKLKLCTKQKLAKPVKTCKNYGTTVILAASFFAVVVVVVVVVVTVTVTVAVVVSDPSSARIFSHVLPNVNTVFMCVSLTVRADLGFGVLGVWGGGGGV